MERKYNNIEDIREFENRLHKSIFEKAGPFLRTRQNDVHTIMCYGYAIHLLSVEGGDPSVVIPAILLHDVGYSSLSEDMQLLAFGPVIKEPDLQRKHEIEGARLARVILSEMKYPQDLICKVEQIIDGHDTRMDATDINDMIVKDSDKLFRFSRTGFTFIVNRFNREPREYLAWLSEIAESWFFTKSAYGLACEKIRKREEDLDRNLYYTAAPGLIADNQH
jgi:hypothetical protein